MRFGTVHEVDYGGDVGQVRYFEIVDGRMMTIMDNDSDGWSRYELGEVWWPDPENEAAGDTVYRLLAEGAA